METKLVKVPFNVELAKLIQDGDVEGKIITDDGRIVRIVCFDAVREDSLVVLVPEGCIEKTYNYTPDGRVFVNDKSPLDLMLKIPEYMTFKDGDVLYVRVYGGRQYVFIYHDNGKDKTNIYAALDSEDTLFIENNRITSNDDISELRFATEEEKQKLIDALKESKEPKAKEYLKRFFGIEVKPECKFKPFDKVLVRDYDGGVWKPDIFLNNSDGCNYMCTGGVVWAQCIPYNEKTSHLLGTTEDYKEA